MIEELRRSLLLSHRESLTRAIRRLVHNEVDAEDLAQDVVITLLSHHTGPPDRESFLGWCFGVARNLAAHRYRSETRRRKQTERSSFDADIAGDRPLEDPEGRAMAREQLAIKLDELDLRAVALLFDRFVLQETSEEIAARLKVSSASIRMRLTRLVASLRIEVGEVTVTGAESIRRYDPRATGNN